MTAITGVDRLRQVVSLPNLDLNLLIALEAEFGVEFPDAMLTREVFESVASLRTAIAELKSAAAA